MCSTLYNSLYPYSQFNTPGNSPHIIQTNQGLFIVPSTVFQTYAPLPSEQSDTSELIAAAPIPSKKNVKSDEIIENKSTTTVKEVLITTIGYIFLDALGGVSLGLGVQAPNDELKAFGITVGSLFFLSAQGLLFAKAISWYKKRKQEKNDEPEVALEVFNNENSLQTNEYTPVPTYAIKTIS